MEIWKLLFCHSKLENEAFKIGNVTFILEMLLLFWKCCFYFGNVQKWILPFPILNGKKVAFIFPLAGFQYYLSRFEPPKKWVGGSEVVVVVYVICNISIIIQLFNECKLSAVSC